jgi:hypothetical protein
MKPEKLVQHLSDALRKAGAKVRVEEGNFRGGECIFAAEKLVILNRRMTMEERAEVLARALGGMSLDEVFVVPEVRAFVEKVMQAQNTTSPEEGE